MDLCVVCEGKGRAGECEECVCLGCVQQCLRRVAVCMHVCCFTVAVAACGAWLCACVCCLLHTHVAQRAVDGGYGRLQ